MRLTGRRLTLLLTTLLVIVLLSGATAAWTYGRSYERESTAITDYRIGPSDDSAVRLSGRAAEHPRSSEVRALLQRYFDAINNRDYGLWKRTVAVIQSAPQTQGRWIKGYSTTFDSNVAVLAVSDGPLRVRTVFSSQQSVELAPPSLPASCINWDVTYLLGDQDGRLVLTGIDPSAQSMTACG